VERSTEALTSSEELCARFQKFTRHPRQVKPPEKPSLPSDSRRYRQDPHGGRQDPRGYIADPRYRGDPRFGREARYRDGQPRYGDQPPYGGQFRYPEQPRRRPEPPHGSQPRRRLEESPAAASSGGAEGNERLTALTGAVLLLLLAAEGATLLQLHRMITVHFFLGMLLLGPVAVKAGSTIYRFYRYYTGNAPYRRKGPPAPLLRLLGPLIIASTVGIFGSGIALAFVGPGKGPWLFLHKGSFVVWFCATTVHVLAYAPRIPRLLSAEFRGEYARYAGRAAGVLGGRGLRVTLLAASLLAGLAIAMLTVHLAAPWTFARSH
jgi:hypothetical protein